jgi:branched-chain amino acid transport system permease protein
MTKIIKRHPIILLFIAICGIFPIVNTNQYLVRVLMEVFFFAAMGNAWNIIGGFGKQTSWASSVFFAVGSYTSIILFTRYGGVSPWISVILGMAFAAGLAVIIGKPCFRLRGVFFSIATIACTTIFRQMLIYFESFTGGSLGLSFKIRKGNSLWNLHFDSDIPFYYIALIWMLITVAIVIYIERNKLGYFLRAICEDQDAAESLGIESAKIKLKAFVVSSMMLAFTGTIYVFKTGFAEPNTLASHDMAIRIGIVAILGGMGYVWGPTLGALISVLLLEISNTYLQDFGGGAAGWALYGLLIVLIVLFRPNGLISLFDAFKERFAKRKVMKSIKKGETT